MNISLIIIGASVLLGVIVVMTMVPVRLWIAAKASNAGVGILTMIAMRLRRVPPDQVVNARIAAVKAGLDVEVDLLESHYLAGGHVDRVVNALISADKANMDLDFQRAAAIDLAGRHVFEAVQMSVNPKVIETPKVAAVAKDGIQLLCIARITVRTNLERLVGGAGESTVLARVGEGVVSTIGSAQTYEQVLENPDTISKSVLTRGLDSGTAFEILSVDIADVDVGANIGAKLQTEQAEADKQVAQARAEARRAQAVASEQENVAKIAEMRAQLVQAEAEVPKAMADALRSGRLGVMDYYNMKNVIADTEMRQSLGGSTPDADGSQS
ncbi:MAG: flotillin-like protein FloA [Proteobacteria bacterium]|nr:flotillin-like protein FloA [Pseudomonadota bacterium]